MARAYSLDLRERVVAAVADGLSRRAVADRFGVSVVASVVKWSQRLRATGSVAAKPMGGRRPYALEGERDWLLARVGEAPDLTLRALAAELAARGILEPLRGVAPADPGRSPSRKSVRASEQERADVVRRRVQWKKYQSRLDPTRLVFIDETWAKTNMTRTHGPSRRGARLVAHAPQGRWRTLTFLAALRCDRIDAPCVIDGPINGQSFLAYVEQIPVSDAAARRYRDPRQPRKPQGQGGQAGHPRGWRQAVLPAAL
jgi:hypothetical protein